MLAYSTCSGCDALLRIGSLCTGYGGLDMAAAAVSGARLTWCAETDKHASRLLKERYPGAPNLGDLTVVDWTSVEPVDILTAGYPCQPFSTAGNRLGEHDDRYLWPYIRRAIGVLRPRIAILENVSGHLGLGFDRVLGDCAEDGLHVRWVSVRASDAGAPHRRERLFFTVTDSERLGYNTSLSLSCSEAGHQVPSWVAGRGEAAVDTDRPRREGGGPKAKGAQLEPERLPGVWGEYEPAIRRWEQLTRPAPAPRDLNKNGKPRLAAAFDEWMMGLPAGWVTDIDIPYGAMTQMCGNGVVPQQAELAIRLLLA